MLYSLVYRLVLILSNIPYRCYSLSRNTECNLASNVMFVQGAFVTPPDRYPMKFFWNSNSNKSLSSPILGPLSSIDERAVQLFASIDRQNNKSIKFIAHSAGCNTVLKLIEYLHYHHCGMIKQGLVQNNVDVEDLVTNPNYQILFTEVDGSPVHISPSYVEKIALVSPPLAGVDLLNNYPASGNKWSIESISLAVAHLIEAVVGENAMLCLNGISNRLHYIRYGPSIFKSLTPERAMKDTETALAICKLYKIDAMRVITHYSEQICEREYVKPDAHPVLMLYIPMYLETMKRVKSNIDTCSTHDGLISVNSQRFMLGCDCQYTHDVYECNNCKTVYAHIDHFCISIGNTAREVRISEQVWSKVFDYIGA